MICRERRKELFPARRLRKKIIQPTPLEGGRHLYQRHRSGIFLTTPIEMAVYIASIANNGRVVVPHLIKNENFYPSSFAKKRGYFRGKFQDSERGDENGSYGRNGARFEFSRLENRRQTGTAEVGGKKNFIHSWVVGFYPYENPKYAFVAVLEKGPAGTTIGAPYAMRQFFDWLKLYHPEYTR